MDRRARPGLEPPARVAAVILDNGVIRTLDPSLPLARALAVAGERVAGGIGTHETALASPEVVDLGGRCVIPGITDSHTHFPNWATALRLIPPEGATSAEDAAERMRAGAGEAKPGRWFRAQ